MSNDSNSNTKSDTHNMMLPPLFAEDFGKGNLSWKRLDTIAFEEIGRVLACHLVLENYLNKLLELRLNKDIDIDSANLNFSQKLKMLRNDHALKYVDFYQGIGIINKVRNKYSHHLEAKIDSSEIGILRAIIFSFLEKTNPEKKLSQLELSSDVLVIERFTSLFCAFIAGYCSSLVEGWR